MSDTAILNQIKKGLDLTLVSYEDDEELSYALMECLSSALAGNNIDVSQSSIQLALDEFGHFGNDYYSNISNLLVRRIELADFLVSRGIGR